MKKYMYIIALREDGVKKDRYSAGEEGEWELEVRHKMWLLNASDCHISKGKFSTHTSNQHSEMSNIE